MLKICKTELSGTIWHLAVCRKSQTTAVHLSHELDCCRINNADLESGEVCYIGIRHTFKECHSSRNDVEFMNRFEIHTLGPNQDFAAYHLHH